MTFKKGFLTVACLGISVILVFFLGLHFFSEWWQSGDLQATIPTDLIPTAEYLYNNPLPVPEEISISPEIGEPITGDDEICVYTNTTAYALWSHILINGKRISYDDFTSMITSRLDTPDTMSFCFPSWENEERRFQLDEGLHLIEIKLRENPFDLKLDYQWAIRVQRSG